MKKREKEIEQWETPSLEWIHRVRRERLMERQGRPVRPISHKEAELLAQQYGLKLARPVSAGH
jgi:hypothetical protein